jgi:hypothetical protein
MKRNVSVVRLVVATRSNGPPGSGKIIKEMPGSVASGTLYIIEMFYLIVSQLQPVYRFTDVTSPIFVNFMQFI